MTLTKAEADAVRFYEGDLTGFDLRDPFLNDARAYLTLNALLFDGVRTEYLRVQEGKRLNPAMLADLPRLTSLYRALLSAAQKAAVTEPVCGYRVERTGDFTVCKAAGQTLAFTSTCLSEFLPAYGDKQEIVLLTYHIPPQTPAIIFSQLPGRYLKANENELLLPPYLRFECSERPLTDADREIRDMNGNPPCAAYDLTICAGQQVHLPDEPTMQKCAAGIRIFAQIHAGVPEEQLDPDDLAAYLRCKEIVQRSMHE
ncbi:MAG: hypothetical protein MJ065_02175 [Oscillospiraceae bacterium]|nr:hypothetical protein [Oscillospiraceae bacterium]